jgi:hypothetical protein
MYPLRVTYPLVLLSLFAVSASAQPFNPPAPIVGEAPGDAFGTAVAAGNVNGDAFGDVLVRRGSSFLSADEPGENTELDLFLGASGFPAPGLTAAAAALTFSNPSDGDHNFGYSFALGDLTGDGVDEVVVGAPGDDTNGVLSGAVYVYCGGPAMDTTPDVIIYGPVNPASETGDFGDEFRMAIGTDLAVGDVDGDGIADLVVLGHFRFSTLGVAYVFPGAGDFCDGAPRVLQADVDATARVEIRPASGLFTTFFLRLGDLNGDGLLDIAVLDNTDDSKLNLPEDPGSMIDGVLYVFYSSPVLPAFREATDADVYIVGAGLFDESDDYDEGFAPSLLSLDGPFAIGDLDGDGHADIAIAGRRLDPVDYSTAEHLVFVFYGGGALPQLVLADDADARVELHARHLAIGDPDGDGTDDLLASSAGGTLYAFAGGAPFPPVVPAAARAYTLPGGPFAVLTNPNGGTCPGLGVGEPSFGGTGRAQIHTCAAVDNTPPECGRIVVERDDQGRLTAVASSATDPESGIMGLVFTRLQNLRGYAQGEGPYAQGNGVWFPQPYPTSVSFRGERISFSAGGALLVTVYNGFQLSSVCDPVIAQLSATAPEATSLSVPYPNPASGPVVFRFALAEPGTVALTVYDVAGREVARLVESEMEPGHYEATWAAQDLAAGAYVVRLAAGHSVHTQRLTLVR